MNFYDKVTEENALEWYKELPAHLKKSIDEKRAKFKSGQECQRRENETLFDTVTKELGKRPLRPAEPADPLDGWTHSQMAQFDALKAWGARYDELLLIGILVISAEEIQRDRQLLSKALGLDNAGKIPDQSDGLDAVQAATVEWIQSTGETPLEFLAGTYRNDELKIGDRLTAARALLDFVHRRVPVKSEVKTEEVGVPKLDPSMLRKLSPKELDVLEKLLGKLSE